MTTQPTLTPQHATKAQPHPEPLPPAEHDKAVRQAETRERNLNGTSTRPDAELPQTHKPAD